MDQAIEIGLPGDRERRGLLRRYAGGLSVADETIAHVSRCTGKVSPAFIRELARRAAQAMLERGGRGLEDADFTRAFDDMAGAGGKVTTKLLGAEGFGFVPQA